MSRIPIDELYNAEREVGGHIELAQSIGDMTPLANHDIVPTMANQRTWSTTHIASLWVGMAVCIPTYQLAGGMLNSGMSWSQAIFTVFLGNLIVLIPMILNAVPGTKYGIPFPVLVRASFGTLGSNVPAILRALVACGWFGIQTWIGGSAIYELVKIVSPGIEAAPHTPLGINAAQLGCFLFFWLMNMYFIWKGTESIKWMETLAAPFLIILGLMLLGWAYNRAGGFGPMLATPSKFQSNGEFIKSFAPWLTAMVGFWATLSLNIPDFSRYARSQKDQIWGQTIGLPSTMTLYSFIGIAVTSAALVIWTGPDALKNAWDPVEVTAKVGHEFIAGGRASLGYGVIILGMIGLLVATLSTNIAANVVSPANDFANIAPRRISFKMGGLITGVIGILIMPWKLIETTQGYIFTWLIGYGTLLGPIAGIMLGDYFIVRGGKLNLLDLYREKGVYSYSAGFNPAALGALVAGILPNVKGFWRAATMDPKDIAAARTMWDSVYDYGWFVGLAVALVVYCAWMKAAPPSTGKAVEMPA
ncbi:MAG: NCS1 family nucleobase:cation symporter-1 [Candidatus Hydrogenedentota bacterium]